MIDLSIALQAARHRAGVAFGRDANVDRIATGSTGETVIQVRGVDIHALARSL